MTATAIHHTLGIKPQQKLIADMQTLQGAYPVQLTASREFVTIGDNRPILIDALVAFADFYTGNKFGEDFAYSTDKHDFKQLSSFLWALEESQAIE
jgi:hypothetical protein